MAPDPVEHQFTYALAYCLAYPDHAQIAALSEWRDGGDGDTARAHASVQGLLQAAQWALGLPDAVAMDAAMQHRRVVLVAGGATKIKGYVFESAKLPEIRGASALLDRINIVDVPNLWREQLCEECLIYYAGGEVLAFAPASTPNESPAQELADSIERLYTRHTLVAQSVAVAQEFTLNQLRNGITADAALTDAQQNALHALLGYDLLPASLAQSPAAASAANDTPSPLSPSEEGAFGSLITSLAFARFRRRECNYEEGERGKREAERKGEETEEAGQSPIANRQSTIHNRQSPLRVLPHFATVPFARRCTSCDRRAAIVRLEGTEEDALCEPCARKRYVGQLAKQDKDRDWWSKAKFHWPPEGWWQETGIKAEDNFTSWEAQFRDWLIKPGNDKHNKLAADYYSSGPTPYAVGAANDVDEIAQAATPKGYLGVVYADGNNMGGLLESLRTPIEYKHFADAVSDALRESVFEALALHLRPQQVRRENGSVWIHPFEILSIGGDDLFLLVPAHAALPLAIAISNGVEERLLKFPQFREEEGYAWNNAQRLPPPSESVMPQCKVSLSTGVVLSDESTPVFYLEQRASELLKSAKRKAKKLKRERHYMGGTIDFASLKAFGQVAGTMEQYRDAALSTAQGKLTARPYTIAETQAMLDSVALLKHAEFPKTQLYRLRESLFTSRNQSIVDYLYFLSRSNEARKARERIEGHWATSKCHPWREVLPDAIPSSDKMPSVTHETIWFDLVELYPFVDKADKAHLAPQINANINSADRENPSA